MPDDVLSPLDEFLQAETPDIARFKEDMKFRRNTSRGKDLIACQTASRLASATLSSMEKNSWADVTVLLRQIVRSWRPLTIRTSLWDLIRPLAVDSHLVGTPVDMDRVEVMALPWHSSWLSHSESIDALELRLSDESVPGDGTLYAMSKAAGLDWPTYRSGAQKAAVDCWEFAAPGSTTLVTLPTGGGKSLCALLPPWFASRSGRRSRGTTLVVVPTVSLALDQERQGARFFRHAFDEMSRPISRTGDTSPSERTLIEAALHDGRLPVIYTSPESLLGSRLYGVVLNAARDGLITRFVIDEAHLIASWGAGFRPEFQLLAAYRRRLLEASGGELRTLLLSATMAEGGRAVVESLFAEPGKLVVVEANRLRPEIGYWLNLARSDSVRRNRVLEALAHLPRPLILYVTRPDQAKRWESELRTTGYARLASFTGETDADSRRMLIKKWDSNEIDLMVATSAFGLGVDKSDVRAVVHATLPENIDRFYQEIGRGGRDGYSSVSLLCAAHDFDEKKDDFKMAYSLMPRLITLEKALPRWKGMIDTAVADGRVRWVDRDAIPQGREFARSERNREWNEHLLLLMQRAGLIEIDDAPPPRRAGDGDFLNRVPIRIVDGDVYNDPGRTLARIEPYREEEKKRGVEAARDIADLVSKCGGSDVDGCLSERFGRVYDGVQYACGGCPACRAQARATWSNDLEFTVDFPAQLRAAVMGDSDLDETLRKRLGAWRALNITWTGPRRLVGAAPWAELIAGLVRAGFQQVIYPTALLDDPRMVAEVMAALAEPDPTRPPRMHRLIPDAWVVGRSYPLFPLATLAIYPADDPGGDRLFRSLQNVHERGIVFPAVINIVHEALWLASAGKRFTEHVDGLVDSLPRLQTLLRSTNELPEYF